MTTPTTAPCQSTSAPPDCPELTGAATSTIPRNAFRDRSAALSATMVLLSAVTRPERGPTASS